MIGTGSLASRSNVPPGFEGGIAGHAPGHLLGSQLGGSGVEPSNLVTLFQNPANHPAMSGFESRVRSALEAGQTVTLDVTPIYRGSEPIPVGITMHAESPNGVLFWMSILNRGT